LRQFETMVMAERIAGYELGSKNSRKMNGKRIEERRIIVQEKFKHVYRFKVTLNYIKPAIWRSIEVPENYSFWDLHVAIQDAMGWLDYHLHQFLIKEPRTGRELIIGIPLETMFGDDLQIIPGWKEDIANFFNMGNRRALYEYDFGDGWEHRVLLQEIKPAEKDQEYPRCVSGKRACPPEDCGGPGGYQNLIETIGDPEDPDYEDIKMWLGEDYDPDYFDPEDVIFDNPQERLRRVLENL